MKHVPNILTIIRIILAPVFLWVALAHQPGDYLLWWALAIFVVASVTDWLDGKLARKYNVISDFGRLWDPLADKFIVLAALGVLTFASPLHLHWLIFAIIFLRELLVTLMRKVYVKRNIVIAADYWGKVKTTLQMIGIVAALTLWAAEYVNPTVVLIVQIWFWLVAVVTVLSGLNYLRYKQHKGQKK